MVMMERLAGVQLSFHPALPRGMATVGPHTVKTYSNSTFLYSNLTLHSLFLLVAQNIKVTPYLFFLLYMCFRGVVVVTFSLWFETGWKHFSCPVSSDKLSLCAKLNVMTVNTSSRTASLEHHTIILSICLG